MTGVARYAGPATHELRRERSQERYRIFGATWPSAATASSPLETTASTILSPDERATSRSWPGPPTRRWRCTGAARCGRCPRSRQWRDRRHYRARPSWQPRNDRSRRDELARSLSLRGHHRLRCDASTPPRQARRTRPARAACPVARHVSTAQLDSLPAVFAVGRRARAETFGHGTCGQAFVNPLENDPRTGSSYAYAHR